MGSCSKLRNSGILCRWVGPHQTRGREISKEAVVVIQVKERVRDERRGQAQDFEGGMYKIETDLDREVSRTLKLDSRTCR